MSTSVAKTVSEWVRQGREVALATVVDTSGSSPRAVGSVMAMTSKGELCGSVSAGCAEGAVIDAALDCLDARQAALVRFDAETAGEWDVAAPCGTGVSVLVQPLDDEVHCELLRRMETGESYEFALVIDKNHPMFGSCALWVEDDGKDAENRCTVLGSWMEQTFLEEARGVLDRMGQQASDRSQHRGTEPSLFHTTTDGSQHLRTSIMGAETLLIRSAPQWTVVCVGAVHIAEHLIRFAGELGYRTVVVDPRGTFALQERFSQASAVISRSPQEAFAEMPLTARTCLCTLTHDEKIDVPALAAALESDAAYIGCLGSFKTLRARKAALTAEGFGEADFQRIRGPIGLYIGGNTPAEIALGIMAQIQAARYGCLRPGEVASGHTLADIPDAEAPAAETTTGQCATSSPAKDA